MPVASAKAVSPSTGVCTGTIARRGRHGPSARFVACVLVSLALVATMPSVVSAGPRARLRARRLRSAFARRPETGRLHWHAGDDLTGRRIDDVAAGIDSNDRRDQPSFMVIAADPMPDFTRSSALLADCGAGAAPTFPSSTGLEAACRRAIATVRARPNSPDRRLEDRTGSRPERLARLNRQR